jgi:hypothetical protein
MVAGADKKPRPRAKKYRLKITARYQNLKLEV